MREAILEESSYRREGFDTVDGYFAVSGAFISFLSAGSRLTTLLRHCPASSENDPREQSETDGPAMASISGFTDASIAITWLRQIIGR